MNNTDQRSNSISSAFDFDDRQYKPVLKPVSPSCSGDSYSHTSDESITKTLRQVTLTKPNDVGFGFNIIGGIMREEIYVSFILAGGAADVSKKLFKGDQILKINGQDISHCSHRTVVQLLKSSGNKVHLTVIYKPEEFRSCENHLQEFDDIMQSSGVNNPLSPSSSGAATIGYSTIGSLRTTSKRTLYVRTLFDYDVTKDCGLPNKGLSFDFGTVLHVTNASDPEWWQARKINLHTGEDDTDLGIIPSKQRVERKNRSKQRKVRILCSAEQEFLVGDSSAGGIGRAGSLLTNENHLLQNHQQGLSFGISDSDSSNSNLSRSTENGSKYSSSSCSSTTISTTADPTSSSSSHNHHHHHKKIHNGAGSILTKLTKGKSASSKSVTASSSSNNKHGTVVNSNKHTDSRESLDLSLPQSSSSCLTKDKKSSQLSPSSEHLFYQPVVQEDNLIYRPVILLGACKEAVNSALLREHSDEFSLCIPHTTRPHCPEQDGPECTDFYFVSTQEMEALLHSHRLIETGRSGPHLYGTSLQAVVDVAESNRHCILDISCAAVRRLCLSGLWPIVMLVTPVSVQSPSSVDSLRRLIISANTSMGLSPHNNNSDVVGVDDATLQKQMNKIERLKHEYLPYITEIVSGSSFQEVYDKVYHKISLHNSRRIWLPSGQNL